MRSDSQCKHTRRTGAITMHRCERPATKDGYCTRHHPSYLSPKEVEAYERWEREERPYYDNLRKRLKAKAEEGTK
jgi:hypothetical protein